MDANTQNPFQTPTAELADNSAAPVSERLYSYAAIGLATFFGTPLAGAWLLVHNLRCFRLEGVVATTWALAVGLLVGTIALSWVLPEDVPAAPFAIVQIFVMHQFAKKALGGRLEQHGQFYSNWRAVGIGILFSLALLAVLIPVMLLIFL